MEREGRPHLVPLACMLLDCPLVCRGTVRVVADVNGGA